MLLLLFSTQPLTGCFIVSGLIMLSICVASSSGIQWSQSVSWIQESFNRFIPWTPHVFESNDDLLFFILRYLQDQIILCQDSAQGSMSISTRSACPRSYKMRFHWRAPRGQKAHVYLTNSSSSSAYFNKTLFSTPSLYSYFIAKSMDNQSNTFL